MVDGVLRVHGTTTLRVHCTPYLRVHCTTALKPAIDRLAPAFEAAHSVELTLTFGPSGRMSKIIADGDTTDVAIVTGPGIDDLTERGSILAGTRRDIARSRLGLAVPEGTARPDISSLDGFKAALLAARSIAMSHPTGGALSGAHLVTMFARLGIADAVRAKAIYGPGGPAGLVGNFLVRGEADLGLQQMSELLAVPGIDVVGPLPDEVQLVTVFAAGVSSTTHQCELARAFIAHLASSQAAADMRDCGLDPCAG